MLACTCTPCRQPQALGHACAWLQRLVPAGCPCAAAPGSPSCLTTPRPPLRRSIEEKRSKPHAAYSLGAISLDLGGCGTTSGWDHPSHRNEGYRGPRGHCPMLNPPPPDNWPGSPTTPARAPLLRALLAYLRSAVRRKVPAFPPPRGPPPLPCPHVLVRRPLVPSVGTCASLRFGRRSQSPIPH